MDEVVIEDGDLLGALHEFHAHRESVVTATKERDKALDKVKSLIPKEAMAEMTHDGKALRVGSFRIAYHDIEGGHREFDTKSRSVMRISPPKE